MKQEAEINEMIRVHLQNHGNVSDEIYCYNSNILQNVEYFKCAVGFEEILHQKDQRGEIKDVWISEETQQYVTPRSYRYLHQIFCKDGENEIPFEVFEELVQTLSYLGVSNSDEILSSLIDNGNIFYTKIKKYLEPIGEDSEQDTGFVQGILSVWNLADDMDKTKLAFADLIVFLSDRCSMIKLLPSFVVDFVCDRWRVRRFGFSVDVLRVALTWFRFNPDYKMFVKFCDTFQRDSLMCSRVRSAIMAQHDEIDHVYNLCKLSEKTKPTLVDECIRYEMGRFIRLTRMYMKFDVDENFDFETSNGTILDNEKLRQLCLRMHETIETKPRKSGADILLEILHRKPRPPRHYFYSYVIRRGCQLYEYNQYLKMFRLISNLPQLCHEVDDHKLIVVPIYGCGLMLTISEPTPSFPSPKCWYLSFKETTFQNDDWTLVLNSHDPNSNLWTVMTANSVHPIFATCMLSKDSGYFVNTFYEFDEDCEEFKVINTDVTCKSLRCVAHRRTSARQDTLYMLKVHYSSVELEKVLYDPEWTTTIETKKCSLPDQFQNNPSLFCLPNGNAVVFSAGEINVSDGTLQVHVLHFTDDEIYTEFVFRVGDDRYPDDTLADATVSNFVGETIKERVIIRFAQHLPYPTMFDGRILIVDIQTKTAFFKNIYTLSSDELANDALHPGIYRFLPQPSHRYSYCLSYRSRIPSSRLNFWMPQESNGSSDNTVLNSSMPTTLLGKSTQHDQS